MPYVFHANSQAGILTGLAHGHVVEMRGFYKWDEAYCLALEHMDGGELCEDIIRRVFYSEACARRVTRATERPNAPKNTLTFLENPLP